jgi:signal transduction histidine kinase
MLAVLAAVVGGAGEAVAIAASPPGSARWNEAAIAAAVVAYAAVGLLICWQQPRQPVGRIALAIAPVWGVGQALVAISYSVLRDHPDDRTAAAVSAVGTLLRGLPWLIAVLWLPLRFPDGRPAPTRLLRVAEVMSATTIVALSCMSLFSPTLSDLRVGDVANPFGAPGPLGNVVNFLGGAGLLTGIAAVGLAVAVLVRRYRGGGSLDRQQTLIFGLAFVPPIAAFALSASDLAQPWLFGLGSIPLPVAIGVAVLQRKLYDVQLVVNHSLTYGALSVAIAGLYALTVGGVGAMLESEGATWLPWVAAGVVAVSFAPLRDALQRAANKLTYGQWSQPSEVLSGIGRRLSDATDVPHLLDALVEELRTSLGLAQVELRDQTGITIAGERGPSNDTLPLMAYGVQVGELRWSGPALRPVDRELLTDVANQLGAVVHAAGLLQQVRASQERLVLAREEERKRLRRDLHDGIGPTLASLTLRVDTLRNQSPSDDEALLALREGIQSAVVDVRRLVEGLRPPAIDELGLPESIRQLALRLEGEEGPVMQVTVEPLPTLPAAVEVAAYRIVQEALVNVVRHAYARTCVVELAAGGSVLRIRVCDDGVGNPSPRDGGVGLTSMRERAEEIGGTLVVAGGGGTQVVAELPCGTEVAP